MAETIGQHGIAAFTNPSNGDALDANIVKGNDNSLRTAYVDHDSDPGIHVQSSPIASRPAAGVAGRKWMTTDTGAVQLWFDTGSSWVPVQVDSTAASTASTIVARDTNGASAFKNVKLDGTTSGTVTVQPAATAGTWSLTLPTGGGTNGQVLTTNGSGVTSWASITVINEQTFNSNGTWTKPSTGSMALIELWGSGGGGSCSTSGNASGGAGGNYMFRILPLSALGATASITVGAGGAGAAAGSNANGGAGNTSVFSSGTLTINVSGSNAAANGFTTEPGGNLGSGSYTSFIIGSGTSSMSTLQVANMARVDGVFSGGYGAAGTQSVFTSSSMYGGGGGASQQGVGAGTSVFGGNGGAVVTNGTAPGGGGGASNNVTKGGDGAAGRVKVTVW